MEEVGWLVHELHFALGFVRGDLCLLNIQRYKNGARKKSFCRRGRNDEGKRIAYQTNIFVYYLMDFRKIF